MSFNLENQNAQGLRSGTTSAEQRFDTISGSMCKCLACFCTEQGCTGPTSPCLLSSFKFLCIKGESHSDAECGGPKGCLSGITKCGPCIVGQKCGACTICNYDIIGSPIRAGENAEDAWMADVFYLFMFCCEGVGFTSNMSPLCYQDTKMCCIEGTARVSADGDGDAGGLCHSRSKMCCIVEAVECPPTMDIGLAICGIKLVGGNPDTARTPNVGAPSQMEMK